MPKISVITTTYNDGEFLPEAIESILNQTFSDFEYLILDDGSTDQITPEIIADYAKRDPRIIYLTNPVNIGRSASTNRALYLANGELIAFMDGDDVSLPQRLEKQLAYLNAHPEIGLLGTGCQLTAKYEGTFIKNLMPATSDGLIRWLLLFTFPLINGSTMGYRENYIRAGKYDIQKTRSQDMDIWFRMTPFARFGCVPEILYSYRVDDSRPISFYNEAIVHTFDVHREYIQSVLGESIDERIFSIFMKTSYPDRVQLPELDTILLANSVEVLFRLYRTFITMNEFSSQEISEIADEVNARCLQIQTIFSEIMQRSACQKFSLSVELTLNKICGETALTESLENELIISYWRYAVGNKLWRIPFVLFHPRKAIPVILNKLKLSKSKEA